MSDTKDSSNNPTSANNAAARAACRDRQAEAIALQMTGEFRSPDAHATVGDLIPQLVGGSHWPGGGWLCVAPAALEEIGDELEILARAVGEDIFDGQESKLERRLLSLSMRAHATAELVERMRRAVSK